MKKQTRDFKGIWIPKEIWLSEELTLQEKFFLVEIDSLDKENGCFASNQYFSEFFNVSRSRCTQVIKSLEEKGFIKVELQRKGNSITKRIINVIGGKMRHHTRDQVLKYFCGICWNKIKGITPDWAK